MFYLLVTIDVGGYFKYLGIIAIKGKYIRLNQIKEYNYNFSRH